MRTSPPTSPQRRLDALTDTQAVGAYALTIGGRPEHPVKPLVTESRSSNTSPRVTGWSQRPESPVAWIQPGTFPVHPVSSETRQRPPEVGPPHPEMTRRQYRERRFLL